jgi:hypothetical protein
MLFISGLLFYYYYFWKCWKVNSGLCTYSVAALCPLNLQTLFNSETGLGLFGLVRFEVEPHGLVWTLWHLSVCLDYK